MFNCDHCFCQICNDRFITIHHKCPLCWAKIDHQIDITNKIQNSESHYNKSTVYLRFK